MPPLRRDTNSSGGSGGQQSDQDQEETETVPDTRGYIPGSPQDPSGTSQNSQEPGSGGSNGGSDSGNGDGGSGQAGLADPGDIRGPSGETVEGPTETVESRGTPERTVTFGEKAGAGLTEKEASSAIGRFATRNSDVVKTGAADRTGTINIDDIGIRQTSDGLEYFVGGETLERRQESFAEGVAYSDRKLFEAAAQKGVEEAEERAEGIAASDRKLFDAAAEAEAKSFAEGVAFSDRDLYKGAVRENVEQQIIDAGQDPADYEIDVEKVGDSFTAQAKTQEQSFIDDATGGLFTEVSGFQREMRVDINERLSEEADPVVKGLTEPRTAEAEAAADYLGDTSDALADVGEDVFTAATLVPRAAASAGAEISERDFEKETLATGAVAAVAAPEPVSSAAGGAVLLGIGAAATAGYAATELGVGAGNQDKSELGVEDASATVTEIETPSGGYTQFSELDVAGETQPSELSVPQDNGTADPTTIRTSELVQPEQYNDLGQETPDELFVGDGLNYIRDGDEFVLTGERPPEFYQDRDFPTGESAVVGRETGSTGVDAVKSTEPATPESVGTGEATTGVGEGIGPGVGDGSGVDMFDGVDNDVGADLGDIFDTAEPTVQSPGFDQPGAFEFDAPTTETYVYGFGTGTGRGGRRKQTRLPDLDFDSGGLDAAADSGSFENLFKNPVADPDSILSGKAFEGNGL